MEGGREREREGGREGGREREREGGRERGRYNNQLISDRSTVISKRQTSKQAFIKHDFTWPLGARLDWFEQKFRVTHLTKET